MERSGEAISGELLILFLPLQQLVEKRRRAALKLVLQRTRGCRLDVHGHLRLADGSGDDRRHNDAAVLLRVATQVSARLCGSSGESVTLPRASSAPVVSWRVLRPLTSKSRDASDTSSDVSVRLARANVPPSRVNADPDPSGGTPDGLPNASTTVRTRSRRSIVPLVIAATIVPRAVSRTVAASLSRRACR